MLISWYAKVVNCTCWLCLGRWSYSGLRAGLVLGGKVLCQEAMVAGASITTNMTSVSKYREFRSINYCTLMCVHRTGSSKPWTVLCIYDLFEHLHTDQISRRLLKWTRSGLIAHGWNAMYSKTIDPDSRFSGVIEGIWDCLPHELPHMLLFSVLKCI